MYIEFLACLAIFGYEFSTIHSSFKASLFRQYLYFLNFLKMNYFWLAFFLFIISIFFWKQALCFNLFLQNVTTSVTFFYPSLFFQFLTSSKQKIIFFGLSAVSFLQYRRSKESSTRSQKLPYNFINRQSFTNCKIALTDYFGTLITWNRKFFQLHQ